MRFKSFIYFIIPFILLGCKKIEDQTDTSIVDDIINLQKKSSSSKIDSNYVYLKKAQDLIQNSSVISDSIQAENNYLLGIHFRKKGNLDSAVFYFHNATEFVKKAITNQRQRDYFQSTWNTYASLDKYGDCFTISNKFKSLLDKETQFKELTLAYYFEETIYNKLKKYDKALAINKTRLQLAKEKDTTNILSALLDQADYKYYYLKDKKGAFAIMDSLLRVKDHLSINQKSFIYGEYGVYQYWEGNYKKAKQDYLESLQYFKKIVKPFNKTNRLATKYNNIAEVCIELKEYNNAKLYLDSVAQIGIQTIDRRLQKSFLKYQLRLASLTNSNINEVTKHLDSIYTYQDKTYADKYNNELVALTKSTINEKKLTEEKQEIEIESIKLQSRLLIVIISSLFLIILGVLYFQKRKHSFEKQNLQMQQRLLRSQMNPHFTFNTLYAIQNELKNDPEKSKKYLLKFSRLLRLILENSIHNYVSLEDEVESLEKYMDLQLLRFPGKFTYKIQLNNLDDEDLMMIPPMLLQPFVENSIEHGFNGIEYIGEVIITLTLTGKFLQCTIDDNGLGIQVHESTNKESTSMKLISDFIKKTTKKEIKIIDKKKINKNESGVIIQFLIPIN